MNTVEQQQALVQKLTDMSTKRRLSWNISNDGDPNTQLGEYYVFIKEGRSAVGSTIYKVIIEDALGNEIDFFDDEDLDNKPGGPFFDLLSNLSQLAKRQARGSDQALNEILKKLDEL